MDPGGGVPAARAQLADTPAMTAAAVIDTTPSSAIVTSCVHSTQGATPLTRTDTNRKQVLPVPAVLWLTEALLDCASNGGGRPDTKPAAAIPSTPHRTQVGPSFSHEWCARGVSTMLDSACNLPVKPEPHSSPVPSRPPQFDSKLVRCSSAHRGREIGKEAAPHATASSLHLTKRYLQPTAAAQLAGLGAVCMCRSHCGDRSTGAAPRLSKRTTCSQRRPPTADSQHWDRYGRTPAP